MPVKNTAMNASDSAARRVKGPPEKITDCSTESAGTVTHLETGVVPVHYKKKIQTPSKSTMFPKADHISCKDISAKAGGRSSTS